MLKFWRSDQCFKIFPKCYPACGPILHFCFGCKGGVAQKLSIDTLITVSTKKNFFSEKKVAGSTF